MAEKESEDAQDKEAIPESALALRKEQVRVKTERFQSVYTNNLAISFSTFDANIIFGEIIGEQEGKAVIEEVIKVNMSRELAKALTILLVKHIKGWESQFGEITIPDLSNAAPPEGAEVSPEA
jgi:hypothetical protein